MEGVINTSDFVDVYGRKPTDQKPPENETNRFMQKHNFLRALNKKPDKNCVALYLNTFNYPNEWETSSFMRLYETDCANAINAGIVGSTGSRHEMNVICESPSKCQTRANF